MKVTIITANWNRVKEIKELYESIKRQTHTNWEWIIVDDHSDMKNYLSVKKLVINDPKVRLLRNNQNRKQAYSRNVAIKVATGEIITNIDSDDVMPQSRLEIIHEGFEKNYEADILYGGWTLVNEKGCKYFKPKPFVPEEFFKENGINNNASAFRKRLGLFYDERYPNGCDDYSMWLCAISRGLTFMTVDENLVYWNNKEGCQSVDKEKELKEEADKVRSFWAKPMISILMPTYNRTKYLKQAIKSVMKQTFTNWELLVIDDGSYINGGLDIVSIIDEFKDNRIRYLRKDHAGLSSALNYGMDRAEGEFIAMLDDDDLWMSFHLEMLYKIIRQLKCGVAYSQTIVGEIKEDNDTLVVTRYGLCGYCDLDKLLISNCLTTCSVLFNRRLIQHHGLYFNESLRTHMDWDFWITLKKLKVDFKFIDIRSNVYRMHSGNMLAHTNDKIVGTTKITSFDDMGTVQMQQIERYKVQ